jgi:hypothetical protein
MKEIITTLHPPSLNYDIITLEALQAMLKTSKGTKIVSMVTITDPDLKKGCNFDVVKVSYVNGVINFNYKSSVNKQREREGNEPDFVSQKRKWGTKLDDSPFISHINKDGCHKLYLEIKVERSIYHQYYSFTEERVISEEFIKPFLKEKRSSSEAQGVEKEIILRDYDVRNIACLIIDGSGFLIKENLEC